MTTADISVYDAPDSLDWDTYLNKLYEDKNPILDKNILNPDTGRKIKISTALSYDDKTKVKQQALKILKKDKSDFEKIPENKRKEVVALLDKLKNMSDEAIAKGNSAPNYDLCQVSVPGTNLFCQVSLDIPRKEMPQLKGTPIKGSQADKLPKDKKGEVDTEAIFRNALKKYGAKLTNKKVDASTLKATQSELVGSKVAGMTDALKQNPKNEGITAPIFVSKDGYILDGHHRWAAQVGLSLNNDKPVMMDVVEVDMSAEDLVKFTNNFCEKIGIKSKAGKVQENKMIVENKIMVKESTYKVGDKVQFKHILSLKPLEGKIVGEYKGDSFIIDTGKQGDFMLSKNDKSIKLLQEKIMSKENLVDFSKYRRGGVPPITKWSKFMSNFNFDVSDMDRVAKHLGYKRFEDLITNDITPLKVKKNPTLLKKIKQCVRAINRMTRDMSEGGMEMLIEKKSAQELIKLVETQTGKKVILVEK